MGDSRAEIDRLFAEVNRALAERARIPALLAALNAHGVPYREIEQVTTISPATAHRWVARARNAGTTP